MPYLFSFLPGKQNAAMFLRCRVGLGLAAPLARRGPPNTFARRGGGLVECRPTSSESNDLRSSATHAKQRFNKKYRHPTLDETLTAQRLKAEVRCMVRARKLGVMTPVPYHVEMQAASIYMEFVKGSSVKEVCCPVAD